MKKGYQKVDDDEGGEVEEVSIELLATEIVLKLEALDDEAEEETIVTAPVTASVLEPT